MSVIKYSVHVLMAFNKVHKKICTLHYITTARHQFRAISTPATLVTMVVLQFRAISTPTTLVTMVVSPK